VPVSAGKKRILLIEDETLIAMLAQQFLDELGYECIGPIENRGLALERALTADYDAAILNLILSGEPAYEIAEAIASRGIPIAFASGMHRTGLDTKWQSYPYISKPYSREDIRDLLLTLFPVELVGIAPTPDMPATQPANTALAEALLRHSTNVRLPEDS